MIKSSLKTNRDLILVLIIYSLLSALLMKFYLYTGGDGISYISIAVYYAAGNWMDAVNGYWSPLYSWLMVPFFLYGVKPINAVYVTHFVSLVAGFFTIIGMWILAGKLELGVTTKRAVIISIIPLILSIALIYDTPDLLLVCILVYYFSIILDPHYPDKLSNGFLCGLFGGLAYFSKTFALAFFCIHFLIFNLLHYFRGQSKEKRNTILKNLFLGFLIFFVLSGIWVASISQKYGEITIGTSGDYNHALIGPDYDTHPVYFLGLIKPPNDNAVSIWEDPSYMRMNDWSPFDSLELFKFQLNLVWGNVIDTSILIENYSFLSLIIIIVALLSIFRSDFDKPLKKTLVDLILTMLIFSGGYCLIFVDWRYLLPVCFLLVITGFYLIDRYYQVRTINIKYKNIFLVILILSFMLAPILNLILSVNTDDETHNLVNTLIGYGIHGNTASNDKWLETFRLTYYLNGNYYGLTKEKNNIKELKKELEHNNIDYYFIWNDSEVIELAGYREITGGKIDRLLIYSKI